MKLLLSLAALLGISAAAPQFGNNRFGNNNRFGSTVRPVQQNIRPIANPGPVSSQNVVPIIAYSNDINVDGSYQYSYQSGDGTSAQAVGSVRPTGLKDAENSVATSVQGSYSYQGPDGQTYTVNYIADENGYRAEGAHLPTPPPIPVEIARSLDFIQAAQINNPSPNYNQNQNQNRFG